MEQTPIHEIHNADLLKLIPISTQRIMEIGCSSGALAREFKKLNPSCHYTGIDIDSTYIDLAKRHCDVTGVLDIDQAPADFYLENQDKEVWIFADTLEHFKNPWGVLENIQKVIPPSGSVVACIPNAQHWTVQVRLSTGNFRYEDMGLMDKTHLRWFTRKTIVELFDQTGYSIVEFGARLLDEPQSEDYVQLIGDLAEFAGADPEESMRDAKAFQYLVRAVPKK
jgi:2-polyprenyl-3-methyl-5-hydroxy-6-metoxy-1,4-benzoquinol methylase